MIFFNKIASHHQILAGKWTPPDNLEFWIASNSSKTQGETITDLSGNGHDTSLTGTGIIYTAGIGFHCTGNCLNDYATINNSSTASHTAFTYYFWFKTPYTDYRWPTIIGGTFYGPRIGIQRGDFANKWRFNVFMNANVTSNDSIELGNNIWNHITWVWTGGSWILRTNDTTIVEGTYAAPLNVAGNHTIGAYYVYGGTATQNHDIDDVMRFNRALSLSELQDIRMNSPYTKI